MQRLIFSLALLVFIGSSFFENPMFGQESRPVPTRRSGKSTQDLERLRPPAVPPLTSEEVGNSIRKGTDYLIRSQRKDGCWGGPQWTGGVDRDPVPGSFRSFDIAVTAMCLEALMDVEQSEAVVEANRKAFQFLIERTNKIKRAGPGDLPHVWAHCYCIQTFSKMHRRESDPQQQKVLADAIAEHLKGLKRWQSIHGGWFYYGSGMSQPINPSCSFVNAAVLIAIRRAKEIGIEGDQKMVAKALKALKMMRKPDSSYLYSAKIGTDKQGAMRPINRPSGSLGRSQACNMALREWEDKRITDEVLEVWLDRLVSRHGWLDMGRKKPIPHESFAAVAGYFYYFGLYYGTLCADALPVAQQQLYKPHLGRLLIERQEKDGSWFDYPLYSYHKPYGTAFALLALQRCQKIREP